jgi:hypothetical protein
MADYRLIALIRGLNHGLALHVKENISLRIKNSGFERSRKVREKTLAPDLNQCLLRFFLAKCNGFKVILFRSGTKQTTFNLFLPL